MPLTLDTVATEDIVRDLASKCRKLRGKYVGSFPVVAVHSPIAIEVRLPNWLHKNIHPVFHPTAALPPRPSASPEPSAALVLAYR